VQIRVVTLFPEFFRGPLQTGLVGRAMERHDVRVEFTNPRDFATDRHRTVDDQPYGGGGGMVARVEPWVAAIEAGSWHAAERSAGSGTDPASEAIVLLTPQGAPLDQEHLGRWASLDRLTLVAGRYEGFDERIRTAVTEEVSLGDFVLTGGEPAAAAIIDGVVRLRRGTLGNAESARADSFGPDLRGLLEHPHYTRPPSWRGLEVPEVLRSGDHARIAAWRRAASLARTAARRPDRLLGVVASVEDRDALDARARDAPRPRLVVDAPATLPLARLWDLAAAYAVEVEMVGPAEAVAAAAAEIAALPDWPLPSPVGRRSPKTRAGRPGVAARDWLRATVVPRPVRAGTPVIGIRRPAGAAGLPDLPAVRPSALRRAEAPVLVLGQGIAQAQWTGRLPPLRAGMLAEPLPDALVLPIQLDRVFREA